MNQLHCLSISRSRKEKEAGGEPRLITVHMLVKLNKKPGQFPVRASFDHLPLCQSARASVLKLSELEIRLGLEGNGVGSWNLYTHHREAVAKLEFQWQRRPGQEG